MMNNKGLIGWVVAAVLAVALGGVLIYEATSGGGGRSAAIGPSGQAQGPPPEVAAQVNAILDAKGKAGEKGRPPDLPAGQQARHLDTNPPQHCDPNAEPNVFAEWRNNPQNLNEAAATADQIVVGTAQGVAAGDPYTASAPNEPGGTVETPVQNVTIHVDQTVKGPARAGGVVTIQRLGDATGCFRVAGDPPYQAGSQYLLLLENGAGGRPPHPISPDGRYEVRLNGALEAVAKSPVASEVAGQTLNQVLARLHG